MINSFRRRRSALHRPGMTLAPQLLPQDYQVSDMSRHQGKWMPPGSSLTILSTAALSHCHLKVSCPKLLQKQSKSMLEITSRYRVPKANLGPLGALRKETVTHNDITQKYSAYHACIGPYACIAPSTLSQLCQREFIIIIYECFLSIGVMGKL